MMTRRPGFTVIELLIAAALGTFIVGFGVQHTYEYFRLQGILMAKTELRHATQQIQDRLGQTLRRALYVVDLADAGTIMVVPQDSDRCGYVCNLDKYELLWWSVQPEPLAPDRTYLTEKRIQTPAFELPDDSTKLTKLFEVTLGTGRRVGSHVESFQIVTETPGIYRTRVVLTRAVPRQQEPAKLAFSELIAVRSKPRSQGVPKFETLFKPPGMAGASGGGGGP
jgi:hypothetical protein